MSFRHGFSPTLLQGFYGTTLFLTALLGWMMIVQLDQNQLLKLERSEINHIQYGLLNQHAWEEKLSHAISRKMRDFQLNSPNRAALRESIEKGLALLITELDQRLREKRGDGNVLERLWGSLEQAAQDQVVDLEKLKTELSGYSETILSELEQPESREEVSKLTLSLIKALSSSSPDADSVNPVKWLMKKYACEDAEDCSNELKELIRVNQERAGILSLSIIFLNLLMFGTAWVFETKRNRQTVMMLMLSSTVLLLCGILTPMIEAEAKITNLTFNFMGEPLVFSNQILYFQSKSVLDVVQLLFQNGTVDMIIVGLLIGTFGVLFPMAKLTSTFIYAYNIINLRKQSIIRFFTLKSGKWSMADVFVVAILMAYIGLDGMISSQMNQLANTQQQFGLLSTHGTELQIGFFMFLGFCLTSLMVSTFLEKEFVDKTGGNPDSGN